MSVKAAQSVVASSTTNPLLLTEEAQKAQAILTEARSCIRTSEAIIPGKEFDLDKEDTERISNGFEKYGADYYRLLKHNSALIRVRQAVLIVLRSMGMGNIKNPNMVNRLAVGKFGVGECGEISDLIGIKARLADLTDVCIIRLACPGPFDSRRTHGFVLLGKGVKEKIKNNSKEEVNLQFKSLKKTAIVLDGQLFDKLIPASEINKCPRFTKYLRERNIDHAFQIEILNFSKEEAREILDQAEKVYSIAVETLKAAKFECPYKDALQENEPLACADELRRRIPNTKWSKNAKAKKVWFEGTEDRVRKIAAYLKANSIKASEPSLAKSGNWIVMIDNPNFEQIDQLPSFTEWSEKADAKV